MQPIAGVRVCPRQCLIHLNAQTGRVWRRDKPVLDPDRAFDQLIMKWCLDAFAHQNVGDRRGQLHIGRPLHRACIKMRGHLRVIGFGHGGHFLHLPNTASPSQGRLQDRGRATAQDSGKLSLGGQPLTRGHRDADRMGDLGHFVDRIRRNGLFEPQRAVGFQRLSQPDRACCRELSMGAKEQIGPAAHGLANSLAKGHRHLDIAHPRHMSAAQRVGAGRVELDGSIAARDTVQCGLCRHLGRSPERIQIVVWQRVKISVGPHTVIHPPAQKRMHRPAPRLAKDVPAGNLKSRKRAHDGQVRPLGKARRIGPPEHQLDILRVLACHMALKHVLDHAAHRLGPDRRGIAFAPANNPVIGRQLDQNPVPPAPTGGRGRGDNDIKIGQFHLKRSLFSVLKNPGGPQAGAAPPLPVQLAQPRGHRQPMRLKAFGRGQPFGTGADGGKRFGRHLGQRSPFHKIHHRQAGGKPGRAGGGQHVVGPTDIVADGLWRPLAEEYRAGMGDLGRQRLGVCDA
mmetsp:Transcript_27498/g.50843  ORF Transcript_27498/g.50843 Transcript_27498/m.50843 type:complete len:511 (-) Transcript_27498:998-2530(-)